MKKLVLILLPIFAFILLACGDNGKDTTQKTESDSYTSVQSPLHPDHPSNSKEAPKRLQFGIGEPAEFFEGDYSVSVEKVEDPFVDTSESEGRKKLVAIEVLYKNNTENMQLTFDEFDWRFFDDSKVYDFQMSFNESKEPRLGSGVNSGGQSRGWITFETPKISENFKLQFVDRNLTNDTIEFVLY